MPTTNSDQLDADGECMTVPNQIVEAVGAGVAEIIDELVAEGLILYRIHETHDVNDEDAAEVAYRVAVNGS